MKWEKVAFSELVEFTPKISLDKDELYDNIPMDVVDGGIKYVQDVNQRIYTGGGTKFGNGDTIFARITPCLENGKIAKVKGLEKGVGFGSTEFFVFRAKENLSDPDFIYYLAKTDLVRQPAIKSMVGASGRQRADKGVVEQIKVPNPPLPTQRKIASILSAYDDLIENNLKRIKLLEEKAQLHYKELMQESTRFDKVRLEEFVSVVKGRKPANVLEQPEDDSQLYLLLDTVERTKSLYTSDLTLPLSKESDVLMCMDGARSGWSFRGMVGAIGSTMAIWRSNSERISGELLYQFMKQNESAMTQGNTGAAIPHANRKFILDMKMAMPPKKETKYFESLTLPIVKLINTLHNQNTKLCEARDILLPRLMNGEIEV